MGATEEAAESIAWKIAETVGGEIGIGVPIVLLHFYKDLNAEVDGIDELAPPNPFFMTHGFTQTASPRTSKYMLNRSYKKMGAATLATAGTLASQATQVDVSGIMMHTNATGSTLAHLKMLDGIAKKYPRSMTVQQWVKACMTAKVFKAGIRSTELAGAAIPIGAVGFATGVAVALARAGVKLKYETLINRTAMELHWRANVEMRLSTIGGGSATKKANGPASAVMFDIFRRRGATRVFGQYNVPAIISETGGWYALRDKLLLM